MEDGCHEDMRRASIALQGHRRGLPGWLLLIRKLPRGRSVAVLGPSTLAKRHFAGFDCCAMARQ